MPAYPRFVQSISNFDGVASATTTLVFAANVQAGAAIAVFLAWQSATVNLLDVRDTLGNSYQLLNNPTSGVAVRGAWALVVGSPPGACTITATWGASVPVKVSLAHEVAGISKTFPLAGSTVVSPTALLSGTDAMIAPSVLEDSDGFYVMACELDSQGSGTVVMVAGTGYVLRESNGSWVSEDRIQPVGGRVSATFTRGSTGSGPDLLGMIALRSAEQTKPIYQRYSSQ